MEGLLGGFGLGFAVAASFGPINVFALSSGLRYGFRAAYGVGVGATVADGTYAVLGGTGAAALLAGGIEGWLQLVGGAALLLVAAAMVRSRRGAARAEVGFARSFAVAVGMTLANPLTIAYWAAAFAAVAPRLHLSRLQAATLLPAGVITGGALWATLLAAGTAFAGRYVDERLLGRLSVASALAIGAFGVWFVAGGVRTLS